MIPLHIRSAESHGFSSSVHDSNNGTTLTALPRGVDEGTYSNSSSSTIVQTSPSATLRRRRPPPSQMVPVDIDDGIKAYVCCCYLFYPISCYPQHLGSSHSTGPVESRAPSITSES